MISWNTSLVIGNTVSRASNTPFTSPDSKHALCLRTGSAGISFSSSLSLEDSSDEDSNSSFLMSSPKRNYSDIIWFITIWRATVSCFETSLESELISFWISFCSFLSFVAALSCSRVYFWLVEMSNMVELLICSSSWVLSWTVSSWLFRDQRCALIYTFGWFRRFFLCSSITSFRATFLSSSFSFLNLSASSRICDFTLNS